MKHLLLLLLASCLSFSSFAQISGITTVCTGSTTTLSDPLAGGTWSSSDTSVATIGLTTGIVYGVAAGMAGILYTPSCCAGTSSINVTVSNAGVIAGANVVCAGSSIVLSDNSGPSGTWTSSNTAVATVNSSISVVYGVAAGSATISYTNTSGCNALKYITVSNCGSLPAVTGPTTVCMGSTINLSDATAGGTWASDNTSVATVSSSGVVYGISAGYANIFYYASGFSIGHTVTVSNCGPPAIAGRDTVCIGTPTQLSDAMAGGTWSTSNTAIATVSSTGLVTGLIATPVIISYTVSGIGTTTMTMQVLTAAACAGVASPITGGNTVCIGATLNLSDATAGGTWTSSNTTIASVGLATGIVTGISGGTTNISYIAPGISAVLTVTVSNPGTIVGASSVCAGTSITLSDFSAASGGTWASSNTAVATVNPSGISVSVYGIIAGTTTISYTTAAGCNISHTVTVLPTGTPGTISGIATVYAGGGTATLTSTMSGGTWSSTNTAIATIDTATGVYTGVSAGTDVISYIIAGCSVIGVATYTITVTAINGISGHVNFTGSPYTGGVKLWLIKYTPSTLNLQAVDSTTVSSSGSSAYYQFVGMATDSFRVKATAFYTPTVTTGYIPTYHTSSFYWNTANVIYHTTGTADINMDINMMSGTPTTGPGFIGGNVSTGANKGTTGGVPVVGMHMYVFNSGTNQLMQSTITDASGNYSFSNLTTGTYYIFPDSINYATTPYTSITLTTGTPAMSVADFIQHTISKTITPVTEGISNTSNVVTALFPNPANDQLTIISSEHITNVTISDIAGKVVYASEYNDQNVRVNISDLPKGIYLVKINGNEVRKFVKE